MGEYCRGKEPIRVVEEHDCKQHLVNYGWYDGTNKCSICNKRYRFNLGTQGWIEEEMGSTAIGNEQVSLFNGYTIMFHCDNCGDNFPIAWPKIINMPNWTKCPVCNKLTADKLYQVEKKEIVLFGVIVDSARGDKYV